MKRFALIAVAGVLALSAVPANGADRAEDSRVFAGGTTPVGGGAFFPGTGVSDGSKMQYPDPLEITQGANVILTNLDEGSVANIHQIRSLKVDNKKASPEEIAQIRSLLDEMEKRQTERGER